MSGAHGVQRRSSGSHQLASAPSVASGVFTDDLEQLSLLPDHHHPHKPSHKHSLSGLLDSKWRAFKTSFLKPAPHLHLDGGTPSPHHLAGAPPPFASSSHAGSLAGGQRSRGVSTQEDEPFLTIEDVKLSKETNEWLLVGLTLLPKISWGWLPFAFSILGFSAALKLLLFITLFSVYSAAILYRLYQHSDLQGCISLADIGEQAFGRRLGRNMTNTLIRGIDVMLPAVMHVGGTRFLQSWLFYSTGVCLPWISLIFGAVVLGLVQIQRLGGHPALVTIVQPVLTGVAIGATLLKLLLLRAQQVRANGGLPMPVDSDAAGVQDWPYFSDAVVAIVQLISANYMGQHVFMESMSGMGSPANFQHSTAWAQVCTLLANLAVAAATLRVQHALHVRGFISFALGGDLLTRFVNFVMWTLMTVKYVIALHASTKSLLPRLPHLLVSWFDDADGVDGELRIRPRQLWFLCSSVVVVMSFLVSGTFPHTFLYLSGLLVSICYIPIAFTLPCLFSLKLLGHQITALEYTLSTWVIPVSIALSALGCWASLYHMALKWGGTDRGGSWGCNLIQH